MKKPFSLIICGLIAVFAFGVGVTAYLMHSKMGLPDKEISGEVDEAEPLSPTNNGGNTVNHSGNTNTNNTELPVEVESYEYQILASQVDQLLEDFKFYEAVEVIAKKVVGLEREGLEFKDELQDLEYDVTYLTYLARETPIEERMMDDRGMADVARTMKDPKRALIAALALPHEIRIQAILSQESLAPIYAGLPVYGDIKTYEGELKNEIQAIYQDVEIVEAEFSLEEYLLKAIIIGSPDGTWKVWRIHEDGERATPYQNISYWKEFYSIIRNKGTQTEREEEMIDGEDGENEGA